MLRYESHRECVLPAACPHLCTLYRPGVLRSRTVVDPMLVKSISVLWFGLCDFRWPEQRVTLRRVTSNSSTINGVRVVAKCPQNDSLKYFSRQSGRSKSLARSCPPSLVDLDVQPLPSTMLGLIDAVCVVRGLGTHATMRATELLSHAHTDILWTG